MTQRTTPTDGPARGFAWTRLLVRVGIALAALLVLVGVLSFWLLRTESGLHFVLARAIGATEGKLTIARSGGSLAGPATIEDLRYRDTAAGVDVHAQRAVIAFSPLELLAARLHLTKLQLDGLDVALTSVPPAAEPPQPAGDVSLAAPLDIVLDRLVLAHAAISSDGTPLLAIDTLDVVGRWTHQGIKLDSIALRSPDGQVDLHGTIAALPGYPGNGALEFRWKVADVAYAGTLSANGDGKVARLAVALTEPTAANVDAELTQAKDWPWTAKVAVPRFDPKRVQKDSSLAALELSLQGSGDVHGGTISGDVAANDHRVRIEPLRYALGDARFVIEALTVRSPEAAGTLEANGTVQLDAKPVAATLALRWSDVVLPADLAGQVLATHGQLDANGSAERFHAAGKLSIGPPGQLADLALDLDGTPEAITLKQLALQQPKGGLDAQGTITLKPTLAWQIDAKANRLDPGAFAAAWPGALDFDLATKGALTDRGPDATIKLDRLGGTLRKRALSGHADLALKPDYVVDGTLDVASGNSRVAVVGRGGNQTDATIRLAIASLGDWLPDAAGRLDGEFRVQGRWPKLAVNGRAHGAKLASGGSTIDALDIATDIASLDPPQGTLSIKASRVASGALAFDGVDIDGSGGRDAHRLALDARGSPLGLRLALSGSANEQGRWKGSLETLDVAIRDAPPLALERAAAMSWDGKQFTASDACLAGGGATLCIGGDGSADGALAARYRIERLPLALVMKLASPDAPVRVEGLIGGHGDVRRSAAGALDGTASLASERGSVAYPDNANQPLLAYTGLALDATLSPQSTHATLRASLDHDGRLDGDVTVSGPPGSAQALGGHLDVALNSLAFVELLTPEVANAKGRLAANYTFAGTTAAPRLNGALTLKGLAAELPSAGLTLHDGEITARATDADHFALDGTLRSGDGALTLSGTGGIGANAPLHATIKGDNFLAADIPAAKVVISPDLVIERTSENLSVGGSVTIPKTAVDLAKLPGGGTAKTSPDVVVVDAEQPAPGQPLPVVVGVEIHLGDDVKLAGLGLDGNIRGQLRIDQRPGKLATGTGTLNVGGTYRAYGQDLKIESGRLLFAGTALDNPGLDIRAARTVLGASGGQSDDTIVAGLQVRGTAQVPVLTVYSQPAMEQSEALSYLITGKPLSGLKSGEGDMLGTAARALGSATGDLLAKGIGARMGVEAGVSDNAAVGGAAFTVGKYLSPKLYLSYGVGLFTPGEVVSLKYIFSKRWNFEAQNATSGNRAGINYRWER
ncbi:translocation/assembly module TamB domain-containing protein [Dokdonella sp.]|uniref:translocation/assembly module TamB domain-containing protein n=1 Tax=Dokdonella sp. TaxID=2291710 RepID=UPI002F4001BC